MSDPVSNAEIEDVLSSIRRLVSEDTSPLHRRKQIAEGAKERFVLTPALRVPDDEEEADRGQNTEPDAASVEDEPQEASGRENTDPQGVAEEGDGAEGPEEGGETMPASDRFAESRQTLEQRIAELEEALQQSPEEWEPDGSEVAASDAPDMAFVADAPEPDGTVGELEAEETEAEETSAAEVTSAAVATEPDGQMAAEAAPDAEEEPFGETKAQDAPFSPETVAEVAEASGNSAEPSAADVDQDLHGPFEEVESPVSEESVDRSDEEWIDFEAQQDADVDDEAQDADQMSFEPEPDDTAASVEGSDHFEPLDADDAEQPEAGEVEDFDLLEDPAVLDEDALRDIVSQLVRDELQGVLGERITRNVRRLVRREIQRAIAMRDLE